VTEFVSSGMRRSEFCRSRGLTFGTLNRHPKKPVLRSNGQEFAKLLFSERFSKSNALTAQRRIALLTAMLSEAVVEKSSARNCCPAE
jgi:hypothetical protein